MRATARWIGTIFAGAALLSAAQADTLQEVRERDVLRCGVNGAAPGLSLRDGDGRWSGLDVDFCRAVAAAVLGSANKVELLPLTGAERLDALTQGRIDLLARNTTWNLSRDLGKGISFVGVLYYDGQGFLVPRGDKLLSTLDLGGKRICALSSTTAPDNLRRYFLRHRMVLELMTFDDLPAAKQAYLDGACDALSADQSQLHGLRTTLENPRAHRVLPEVISKEPLSPAVRKGDAAWFDIVRWTLFTLVNAEEREIDSRNLEQVLERASGDEVRLLVDADGASAALLGLEPGWSARVLKAVGNYAEIYERNLGADSPLRIPRGANALWLDGGLMFAPPTL